MNCNYKNKWYLLVVALGVTEKDQDQDTPELENWKALLKLIGKVNFILIFMNLELLSTMMMCYDKCIKFLFYFVDTYLCKICMNFQPGCDPDQ